MRDPSCARDRVAGDLADLGVRPAAVAAAVLVQRRWPVGRSAVASKRIRFRPAERRSRRAQRVNPDGCSVRRPIDGAVINMDVHLT